MKRHPHQKQIKVLFVSHSEKLNGAERSLLILLNKIDKGHFKPIVVLPKSGPLEKEIKKLNIKVYKIKCPWWFRQRKKFILLIFRIVYNTIFETIALFKLNHVIRKEKINIVYTNSLVVFSGALSARLFKVPHIWHIREILINNPDLSFMFSSKWLFDFVINSSRYVITISQAVAQQFNNKKNIKVVPNAVSNEKVPGNFSNCNIPGISTGDWIVSCIGSLEKRKAQDVAIKAIHIALKEVLDIKLLLVGDGNSVYKQYLRKLISSLNLEDKVIFTGFRYDILNMFQHSRVVLVPSLEEPFGRCTIEAMSVGIPVIGTNSGGTKDIILDNITGYLVPVNDPEAMAEKIRVLYKDPQLAEKMGENGRKRVREEFSSEKHITSIEKILINSLDQ